MRILLDCDGILADFHKMYLPIVNQFTGISLKEEDITSFDVLKHIGKEKYDQIIRNYIQSNQCCLKIPVIEGAKEAVKELQKLGEVVIVTSPMSTATWCFERTQWLRDHFDISKSKIVFAKNKHYVTGNIFVDDCTDNCEKWRKHNDGYPPFLWDRPWNRKDRKDNKGYYEVVDNWEYVIERTKEIKQVLGL